MKQFQYNKVLIAFIFVGLVTALLIDVARWRAEEVNKQVDLAIDYEDLVQLAEQEGKPVPEVLQAAKEAGITSLAVYETTFKKLNANGKVTALAGSELVANYHAGILTDPAWRTLIENGTIKGSDVCVVGHDARTYKEVKEDLLRRLGAARVNAVTVNGVEILVVKANYETFLKMDLGMPTDEMQAVNDAGFFVLARPTNYLGCTPEDVDAVFRRLEDYRVSEVVFSGSQMLGAPKSLQTITSRSAISSSDSSRIRRSCSSTSRTDFPRFPRASATTMSRVFTPSRRTSSRSSRSRRRSSVGRIRIWSATFASTSCASTRNLRPA